MISTNSSSVKIVQHVESALEFSPNALVARRSVINSKLTKSGFVGFCYKNEWNDKRKKQYVM